MTSTPETEAKIKSAKKLAKISWILLGVSCLLSMIPGIGLVVWVFSGPVLLATLIMAILCLTKGLTGQGVGILLCSLIVAPVFMGISACASTVAGAAAVSAAEQSNGGSSGRSRSRARQHEFDTTVGEKTLMPYADLKKLCGENDLIMTNESEETQYLVIHVSVENKADSEKMYDTGRLVVNTPEGKSLKYNRTVYTGKAVSGRLIQPALKVEGIVVYELPVSLKGSVTWEPGAGEDVVSIGDL